MAGEGYPAGGSSGSLSAAQMLLRLTGAATLAAGAMLYGDGDATPATLTIGAANTVLTSDGSVPQWSTSLSLSSLTVGSFMEIRSASDTEAATSTNSVRILRSTGNAGADIFPSAAGHLILMPRTSTSRHVSIWTGTPSASERLRVDSGGVVTVFSTTPSISPATGSLVVAGGMGVGGSASFGGAVTVPNGSAASPGIRLTSEAHGLYRVSATSLGFSVGGVSVMTASDSSLVCSGSAAWTTTLDGAAGSHRTLQATTGGVSRWQLRLANNAAESGSDAGSNFELVAYNDAGASIDTVISITRPSGGGILLARPTTCSSATASVSTTTGALVVTGGIAGGGSIYHGGHTLTTNVRAFDSAVTWNSGAVTFTGWKLNITDTASAAASLLLDLQVGGTSRFSIRKDGAHLSPVVVVGGTVTASAPLLDATQTWNNGAVAFTGIKLNVTNTASANGSYLVDFQTSGTSRFTVEPSGATRIGQISASALALSSAFTVACGTHTAYPASTELKDVSVSCSNTQWSAGAITTQRAFHVVAPTYSFTSASTITTAATLCISGAPNLGANATITNNYALWVVAGIAQFDGGVRVGTTTLISSSVALTNGAGAGAGTITNAPAAGNPTKWIPINDNGTTRYVPAW